MPLKASGSDSKGSLTFNGTLCCVRGAIRAGGPSLPVRGGLSVLKKPGAAGSPAWLWQVEILGGMVRRHDLFYPAADVLFVVPVCRVHQAPQLRQEHVGVEGDGIADEYELVLRLLQAFFGHKLFLVQLLAGTEAGVRDLDVDVGLVARELDQVAGKGVDLYGLAHVEDEDLAASCVGARREDQAHRLGDRHEVAHDVGVRDGDRTALFDLLFEDRDDRAVRVEYIAETYGDELGVRPAEDLACAVAVGVLLAVVREELRQPRAGTVLDRRVEGLDDHLADALRGSHDVRGIDGLVGRDQDESLRAVDHRGVCRLVGADRVVLDALAGAVLHERHVLVRRGVVDDVGLVFLEHAEDPAAVPDRTDEHHEIEVRVLFLQFELHGVGVVLVYVEYDELLRRVVGDLAAELAADRSAAARDEDGLAGDEPEDLLHVGDYRLAAEQVLDLDVLHGADGDVPQHQLVHPRQVLELAAGLLAYVEQVAARSGVGRRYGYVDLADPVFLDHPHYVVAAAGHRHAVDVPAPLVGVVVDEAADVVLDRRDAADIAQDHLPRRAGADDHHVRRVLVLPVAAPVAQQRAQTVEYARPQDRQELQHRTDEIVGERHPDAKDERAGDHDGQREQRAAQRAHDLDVAGEFPDAAVELAEYEYEQTRGREEGDHLLPRVEIFFGYLRETEIESEPERNKIRRVGDQYVVHHEQSGEEHPLFKTVLLFRESAVSGVTVHDRVPPSVYFKFRETRFSRASARALSSEGSCPSFRRTPQLHCCRSRRSA